jgi:hypothetical protein
MAKHWKLDRARADEKKVPLIPAENLRFFDQDHAIPPTATKENQMPEFVKTN